VLFQVCKQEKCHLLVPLGDLDKVLFLPTVLFEGKKRTTYLFHLGKRTKSSFFQPCSLYVALIFLHCHITYSSYNGKGSSLFNPLSAMGDIWPPTIVGYAFASTGSVKSF
jgi:hypothetical protein